MIFALFRNRPPDDPDRARMIYARVVEAARRPELYEAFGAPDTLPGRFELIVLHVCLLLRRLRREGAGGEALGQEIFDEMFRTLDASLREIGVGDLSVPKKIKAMASSFYDGAKAYDAALDAGDEAALALALRRIVYRDAPADDEAPLRLARYAVRAETELAGRDAAALDGHALLFAKSLETVR